MRSYLDAVSGNPRVGSGSCNVVLRHVQRAVRGEGNASEINAHAKEQLVDACHSLPIKISDLLRWNRRELRDPRATSGRARVHRAHSPTPCFRDSSPPYHHSRNRQEYMDAGTGDFLPAARCGVASAAEPSCHIAPFSFLLGRGNSHMVSNGIDLQDTTSNDRPDRGYAWI